MKSRRNGSDRCRIRSARNITVPWSSETITRSRPAKSFCNWRVNCRTREAIRRSVMSTRWIPSCQFPDRFMVPPRNRPDAPCAVASSSDVPRVLVVFDRVAGFLALEVHLVLFAVGVEHVVRAHAQHLREADQKMKQIDDFDAGV